MRSDRPYGPPCRHCRRRRACQGRRGLCQHCYADPDVRDRYPLLRRGGVRRKQSERTCSDSRLDELAARAARRLPLFPARRRNDE